MIGALSLTAALQLGWRVALLASLVVPLMAWWSSQGIAIDAPPTSRVVRGRLPTVFWIAAAVLFCTTAAEWCVTAWGATFVTDAVNVSPDTAVALMAGYFGGVLIGRTLGSRLASRHSPARLLAIALGITAIGFAIWWLSTAPAPALIGLSLLGIGLGNLFPMRVALAVALAPGQSALASGSGRGDVVVRRGPCPAHRRNPGGRYVAEGRARGRPSHGRARRGGTHTRQSNSGPSNRHA